MNKHKNHDLPLTAASPNGKADEQQPVEEITAGQGPVDQGLLCPDEAHQPGETHPQLQDTENMASASPKQERPAVQAEQQQPVDSKDLVQSPNPSLSGHEEADAAVLAESRKDTRRAFLIGGVAAAVGAGF